MESKAVPIGVASATSAGCDPQPLATLRELTRTLRMHYELLPEREVDGDGSSRDVGVEIRMWGAHPRHARPNPGCHLCVDLHARMCELARWATAERRELSWEILPYSPSLYWEAAEKADEVCLELRGMTVDAVGFGTAAQEECRIVRRRLEAAGVHQGSWSNRSRPVT